MARTWGEPLMLRAAANEARRATASVRPTVDDYVLALGRLSAAPSEMPIDLPRRERGVEARLDDLDDLADRLLSFAWALEQLDHASHYPGDVGFRVAIDEATFEALSSAALRGDADPWRLAPDVVRARELIQAITDPMNGMDRRRWNPTAVPVTPFAMEELLRVTRSLPAAGVDALLAYLSDAELEQLGARLDGFAMDRDRSSSPALTFWSHLAASASARHLPRIVAATSTLDPPTTGLLERWRDAGYEVAFQISELAYGSVGSTVFARGRNDPHVVHRSDISQGMLGDCWFVSAMIVVADRDPASLHRMVRENANGTVTVRFPDGVEVTVTTDVVIDPTWERPRPLFAGVSIRDHEHDTDYLDEGPELWPALISKAYAQRVGGWDNVSSGWPEAGFEVLSGWSTAVIDTAELEPGQIQRAVVDGQGIVLATHRRGGSGLPWQGRDSTAARQAFFANNDDVTPAHGYVVDAVKADGTVVASDPWWPTRPPVELSPAELALAVSYITVASPPRASTPSPTTTPSARRNAPATTRRSSTADSDRTNRARDVR